MVVEEAQLPKSLTTLSVDEAGKRLQKIPGGVNVVSEEEIRNGVTPNLQEALSLTPGVWTRSRFGSDEVRLSIRGSGIFAGF